MQRCRYAKTANPSLSRDQGIRRRSQNLIIPQSPGLATVEPSIPWRPWRPGAGFACAQVWPRVWYQRRIDRNPIRDYNPRHLASWIGVAP
jgi:hypothetical protein